LDAADRFLFSQQNSDIKFGPHVFDIAHVLGKEETAKRIEKALIAFTG